MHELSYIIRMADLAAAEAQRNDLHTVDTVEIRVGAMTGLIPEYLSHYYPEAVKGTILDGSRLLIDYRHVQSECTACGTVYAPSRENEYCCPVCGSPRGKLLSGREFDLVRITGE